jgi:hypothetical protein
VTKIGVVRKEQQIHEDLFVPLFADHTRALNASSDSKLADVGNLWYGNSTDTYADRGLTLSPDTKVKGESGLRTRTAKIQSYPSHK